MAHAGGVVGLGAGQVTAVAGALARAFAAEPMMAYVLGDVADPEARLVRLFEGALRFARAVGAVYVPAEEPVGAAACWPLPPPDLPAEVAAGLEPLEAVLGPEGAARFGDVVNHVEAHLGQVVPPPAWYLPVLGVEPAAQGRGVGSTLLQAFLSRAAADGVPACWCTGTPENVAFYERRGAEVVGEGSAPGIGGTYWLFRWQPAGTARE